MDPVGPFAQKRALQCVRQRMCAEFGGRALLGLPAAKVERLAGFRFPNACAGITAPSLSRLVSFTVPDKTRKRRPATA